MTHVCLEYARATEEDDRGLVVVQLLVGPAPRAVRPAGQPLLLHPVELNAIDRLLSRGALFERPANTYAIRRSEADIESDTSHRGLREQVASRLAGLRR